MHVLPRPLAWVVGAKAPPPRTSPKARGPELLALPLLLPPPLLLDAFPELLPPLEPAPPELLEPAPLEVPPEPPPPPPPELVDAPELLAPPPSLPSPSTVTLPPHAATSAKSADIPRTPRVRFMPAEIATAMPAPSTFSQPFRGPFRAPRVVPLGSIRDTPIAATFEYANPVIDVGSVIANKYRLVRLLGEGGMGSVYEAQHLTLGSPVAVKLLHPELARRGGLVERFLQEARVAAQIRSPHVVRVSDVDRTADGHAYIVMDLLVGEPLAASMQREGRLSIPVACDYTSQILEALEVAHAIGVIHRDLKPDNVFVTTESGRPLLKIIDFGIAKAKRGEAEKTLTVAGSLMGTAEYMAPEQARSAGAVDARADIYAVGVMLYEMIAGVRPVTGEDARDVAAKVERGEVVALLHVAPDTPREIAGLVHHAMAPRPEMRFGVGRRDARRAGRGPSAEAGVAHAGCARVLVVRVRCPPAPGSSPAMALAPSPAPAAATPSACRTPSARCPSRRWPVQLRCPSPAAAEAPRYRSRSPSPKWSSIRMAMATAAAAGCARRSPGARDHRARRRGGRSSRAVRSLLPEPARAGGRGPRHRRSRWTRARRHRRPRPPRHGRPAGERGSTLAPAPGPVAPGAPARTTPVAPGSGGRQSVDAARQLNRSSPTFPPRCPASRAAFQLNAALRASERTALGIPDGAAEGVPRRPWVAHRGAEGVGCARGARSRTLGELRRAYDLAPRFGPRSAQLVPAPPFAQPRPPLASARRCWPPSGIRRTRRRARRRDERHIPRSSCPIPS